MYSLPNHIHGQAFPIYSVADPLSWNSVNFHKFAARPVAYANTEALFYKWLNIYQLRTRARPATRFQRQHMDVKCTQEP